MKNLQFEHGGIIYTIEFEYATSTAVRTHYPRKGVVITEEREVRDTYVILGSSSFVLPQMYAYATCQPEDRFVKETGRTLAIHKLAKSLKNQQLASAMLKCYFNRPRGKKKEN